MESRIAVQLPRKAEVVNIGLPDFETSVRTQGAPVVGVEWRIPCNGEKDLVAALGRLMGPSSSLINDANAKVISRLNDGVPLLKGIDRAGAVLPGMSDHSVIHCGPAIRWEDMCDPLRRSIKATIVAEGWAGDVKAAELLIEANEIELKPANEHSTVVPMATSIGPSAPVYIVENAHGGTVAFSSINQGAGEVQWFGVDSEAAINRLRFIRDSVGPVLADVIANKGPIDVLALAGQGVVMGDDVHMRVQATTNLMLRDLLPYLVRCSHPAATDVATFLSCNHLMFLNIAMAAAKSLVDSAAIVDYSSIVTGMSRNGTTYGVQLPGTERRWFFSKSPYVPRALYYPGFGPEVAARDIGDSAVLELIGLGGAAAANSSAVASFLGGSMADAIALTRDMQLICESESKKFRLPNIENSGAPLGVDVRRVVERWITPAVTTGIVHASAGVGQIGAGVASAPVECFTQAMFDLDRRIQGRCG